jgi:hypothetical protein
MSTTALVRAAARAARGAAFALVLAIDLIGAPNVGAGEPIAPAGPTGAVETGEVTTLASGFLAEAEASIASTDANANVAGKTSRQVVTGDASTAAEGFLADACTSVGSIGACQASTNAR